MQRGEKLWVRDGGAWQSATYEFRVEQGEPLGRHSVMLSNGGGRRVVCSCDTSTVEPEGAPPVVEADVLDLDDAHDTIVESMSADDRQTGKQYQAACAALSALLTELREGRASAKAEQAPMQPTNEDK